MRSWKCLPDEGLDSVFSVHRAGKTRAVAGRMFACRHFGSHPEKHFDAIAHIYGFTCGPLLASENRVLLLPGLLPRQAVPLAPVRLTRPGLFSPFGHTNGLTPKLTGTLIAIRPKIAANL
jgi:hypothetical protein